MSWTFTNNSADLLDSVRLSIGDIISTRQLLQDEVILSELVKQSNNVAKTSLVLLDYLIALYSTFGGRMKLGKFEFDASMMVESFAKLRNNLGSTVSAGAAVIWAGGMDQTERILDVEDTNLIQPRFVRDQHKNWVW